MFDYDQVDTVSDDTASAVAADIQQSGIPAAESNEDRELRIAVFELNEAIDRERRAEARERYEFDRQRELERQRQAAQVEARARLREKLDRQQRDHDARRDRERVAALELHHRAEQAQRAQAAREQAVNQYWREFDELLVGLDRLCTPVPPDYTAQRIAALEHELACQADAQAADAERSRSAKYQADQRAAVARRESGGW
jgi:hypothetical protein